MAAHLRIRTYYECFNAPLLAAFPDCPFQIVYVEQRSDTICKIDLVAIGTHAGDLDLGAFGVLKTTGRNS